MSKCLDIRAAVEDELIFDPLLNASYIAVSHEHGGIMTLNGTVPSYPQYLGAAAAARRIAGVTSVSNYLVVLRPGDDREDPALITAANDALTLNITVPAGVDASANDGSITLTGTVRYGFQRAAAERAVARLTGVRDVTDNIEISWDAAPVDVTIAVQDALDRNALIPDDSDVMVDTDGNTVTLTGHVHTWAEHDAVLDAAWMTPGVYDVRDDLYVTG